MKDTPVQKTFADWKADGYSIIRGSKAVGRTSTGVPLFDETQVHMVTRSYSVPRHQRRQRDIGGDYGEHWDFEHASN